MSNSVHVQLQSYPTLCDPIDGSPPGSPVPGILQARILEWVAISSSNAWKWKVKVKVKSCPTRSDPMDCNLPGSSVHGIFQARVLEWGCHCLLRLVRLFMLKILQVKLQQYVNQELPDVQAGFIKGRGTRDKIANIHWIMEKARKF